MSDTDAQILGRPDHWHPNRKRPSLYDEGVLDRFLDKLSSTAQSIRQICEPDDMPRSQDIFIACGRDPALRARIAQAREAQQDVIVDELLTIADTATVEEVNLAKLRIWTRQWAAARFAPKKYGEKQQVEVQHTLSETAARVLQDLSERAKQRQAIERQVIDVTPVPSLSQGVVEPAISTGCEDTARVPHAAPRRRGRAARPPAPATTDDPPLPEQPSLSAEQSEKNRKSL